MKRQFYCVQDKVDVSGTTFTAVFTMLYSYLFVSNLMSNENYISALNFWLQGVCWYIYLLYCLGSYRDARELCFYCKYEMGQGGLHCLLGFLAMTENFQWAFLALVIIVFSCVIFVRMAHKEDREEAKLRKLRKDQYKQNMHDAKKNDDAVEIVVDQAPYGRSSEEGSKVREEAEPAYDGGYLKPAKHTPAPPPKAKQQQQSQLLQPIPED